MEEGGKFMVMAPWFAGARASTGRLLDEMRTQGYARARIDGELRRLDEPIELDKKFKHDLSMVVDRLVMKEGIRKRLSESLEAASQLADGLVEVEIETLSRSREPETQSFSDVSPAWYGGPRCRSSSRGSSRSTLRMAAVTAATDLASSASSIRS